jgi:hypothetical protein
VNDFPTKAELIGLEKGFCDRCAGTGHVPGSIYEIETCPRCDGQGQTLGTRLVKLLWSDDLQARIRAGDWAAIELVKLARDCGGQDPALAAVVNLVADRDRPVYTTPEQRAHRRLAKAVGHSLRFSRNFGRLEGAGGALLFFLLVKLCIWLCA